ncbi:hypothetical protein TNIN_136481 [Trichonephila inaurata madagascariensis]|uniref:Uncharacterized protein n=1 Tax=Trichonephila inaurata madagascariensis TaxID=2747483 RepID=A0A8X7CT37_9ARAC|nr:hypothetical protein TNIN_136481 [Trichonephila inaurata madagascariensis]
MIRAIYIKAWRKSPKLTHQFIPVLNRLRGSSQYPRRYQLNWNCLSGNQNFLYPSIRIFLSFKTSNGYPASSQSEMGWVRQALGIPVLIGVEDLT